MAPFFYRLVLLIGPQATFCYRFAQKEGVRRVTTKMSRTEPKPSNESSTHCSGLDMASNVKFSTSTYYKNIMARIFQVLFLKNKTALSTYQKIVDNIYTNFTMAVSNFLASQTDPEYVSIKIYLSKIRI